MKISTLGTNVMKNHEVYVLILAFGLKFAKLHNGLVC